MRRQDSPLPGRSSSLPTPEHDQGLTYDQSLIAAPGLKCYLASSLLKESLFDDPSSI